MPVLVAVGCSSSLGALALRRFLADVADDADAAPSSRWRIYAGYRGETRPPSGWDPAAAAAVQWVPLDLESLASVNQFATAVSDREQHVDVLLLNAATWDATPRITLRLGTREAVVNYLARHHLIHLLADRLFRVAVVPGEDRLERARIVITTSNLHTSIHSLDQIPAFLQLPPASAPVTGALTPPLAGDRPPSPPTTATATATARQRYAASKAAQLLMAFYWRRRFADLVLLPTESGSSSDELNAADDDNREEKETPARAVDMPRSLPRAAAARVSAVTTKGKRTRRPVDVVAVSPGFVPGTNLSRDSHWLARWFMRYVVSWAPFAVSVEEGAARIARCLPSPSHRRHHLRRLEPDRDRPVDETPTLEALADAVGPDQIVYLSLASSEPFPSPLAAAAEWSSPAAAAAPGWVVVRGGAIGTWAAARGAAEGSGIVDDELAGHLSAAAAEEEVRARHAPPAGGGGGGGGFLARFVPAGRTG